MNSREGDDDLLHILIGCLGRESKWLDEFQTLKHLVLMEWKERKVGERLGAAMGEEKRWRRVHTLFLTWGMEGKA